MKYIKTLEEFVNEAKKSNPEIYKMVDEALTSIQKAEVQLDKVRGHINDNYEVSEIKKMKGYQVLLDTVIDLRNLRDKLNRTNWPDEK